MEIYTASVDHSRESIEAMCIMQFNMFQRPKKIIATVLALALILWGILGALSSAYAIALIAIGCVVLASLDAPARALAQTIYEGFGKKPPRVEYSFTDSDFTYSRDGERLALSSLIRLVDDGTYLYLYVSKKTAYLIDRKTVIGKEGLTGLKKLLSERSGQDWKKVRPMFSFSLGEMLFSRRK